MRARKLHELGLRRSVVALALLVVACAPGERSDRQAGEGSTGDDGRWRVVDAYRVLDAAWHGASQEDRGEHPPIELAVAAARTIVAQPQHPRLADAAEFLIEHPPGLAPDAAEVRELGLAALAVRFGPDWAVVADYRSRMATWEEQRLALLAEPDGEARLRAQDALRDAKPKPFRALAVAKAIVDTESHPQDRQAAEFLVGNGHLARDSGQLAFAGAELLGERFPDYEGWPSLLGALELAAQRSGNEAIQSLFVRLAETGEGKRRAMARYYAATGAMRSANSLEIPQDARARQRRTALELATGLSAGLNDEEFDRTGQFAEDGAPLTGTLAEAERELLFRINHATAGGSLPAASGRRLDGSDETLSAFAGKAVLIDFWATWCSPCVKALPTLRELDDELPDSAFAVLSISVDDELETVLEFQREQPMPWANWHVGSDDDLLDAWGVRAYPTYILVDGDGVILARANTLRPPLIDAIRAAAAT